MKEMREFARLAVEAAGFWNIELDYSAESLEALEKLLGMIHRSKIRQDLPEDILVSAANLFGAYLGEVLLHCGLEDLGFAWVRNKEGATGIGRENIWLEPATKVYRRITQGPEHDLVVFFEVVFGLAIGAVDLEDPRLHILSRKPAKAEEWKRLTGICLLPACPADSAPCPGSLRI